MPTITHAMRLMLNDIISECTPIDREQRFRDMLDDCYSFDSVGGPFAHMTPSRVLEEVDPIAFRCGVNDYMDGEETYEIDGETYDRSEVDEAKEKYLDNLRSELDGAESELADKESELADDDQDELIAAEVNRLTADVARITAEIDECEAYRL